MGNGCTTKVGTVLKAGNVCDAGKCRESLYIERQHLQQCVIHEGRRIKRMAVSNPKARVRTVVLQWQLLGVCAEPLRIADAGAGSDRRWTLRSSRAVTG